MESFVDIIRMNRSQRSPQSGPPSATEKQVA
jgi:hypothetical protein